MRICEKEVMYVSHWITEEDITAVLEKIKVIKKSSFFSLACLTAG